MRIRTWVIYVSANEMVKLGDNLEIASYMRDMLYPGKTLVNTEIEVYGRPVPVRNDYPYFMER